MSYFTPQYQDRSPGQKWENLEGYSSDENSLVQLGTSVTTMYTAPSSTNVSGAITSLAILEDLWLCNASAVDYTVTLHIVKSGGTAGVANSIIYQATIKANQSLHYAQMGSLIPAGGTLQGLASVASKISWRATIRVVR